jgi:hypothetical protein
MVKKLLLFNILFFSKLFNIRDLLKFREFNSLNKKYILVFISLAILPFYAFSTKCTSTGNGPWIPAPVMWSCGHIPGCNDSINIKAGDSIWIASSLDYTTNPYSCAAPMYVNISGTLAFQTGKKLKLPAGSIITIPTGGKIYVGGGGSANLIDIGPVTVWSSNYGTAIGPLTITQNTPLPIELISFTAKLEKQKVAISWITASETNNDFYTIERTSDGFNFDLVAKVDGAGNSTTVLNYSAEDRKPLAGLNYYRLSQTDFNGVSSFFKLASVEYTESSEFSFNLYPNPNNGSTFNISIDSKKDDEVLVVVYDALGKETYSKVIITGSNNDDVYALDPSGKLDSGIYLITATSQQSIQSKRMIVK